MQKEPNRAVHSSDESAHEKVPRLLDFPGSHTGPITDALVLKGFASSLCSTEFDPGFVVPRSRPTAIRPGRDMVGL
jgi:hypothetical protein